MASDPNKTGVADWWDSRVPVAERLAASALEPIKPRQDGTSRFTHALLVADRVREYGPHDTMVALLHDVLEDTGLLAEVISGLFGEQVLADVRTLTREDGIGYTEYIENIAEQGSDTALRVKLADLADNSINTPEELVFRYRRATARLRAEELRRKEARDGR